MTDSSIFPDPTYRDMVLAPLFEGVKTHYAEHMQAIDQAHLVMLCETGILTGGQGREIAKALRDIDREIEIEKLTYTGEFEDYFFLIEAELERRLGDLSGMLHIARSRNDIEHTAFRMALRKKAEKLGGQMLDLADSLTAQARAERDTLIVAYTHGQPAQPTTFGHYLAAVIEVIIRDIERVEHAVDIVDLCPMGAAAITTSGFPIDRNRVSELLGFGEPLVNSYGCIASVDYLTGLYSAVQLVFLHLGRVIQDIGQWSAFEVGQLYVPNSLVQVSSIMPQKRNPVAIEHMRQLASAATGQCSLVLNTMHNTPFADMNDSEGEVQQAGYAAFDYGARALALLAAFLPACSINSERVEANIGTACITVTELADTLVRDEGLSFRHAHAIASATARAVIARGAGLAQGFEDFSDAFSKAAGRKTELAESGYAAAIAPATFVHRRECLGGPAPAALDKALTSYALELRYRRARRTKRDCDRCEAAAALDAAFNSLLEG